MKLTFRESGRTNGKVVVRSCSGEGDSVGQKCRPVRSHHNPSPFRLRRKAEDQTDCLGTRCEEDPQAHGGAGNEAEQHESCRTQGCLGSHEEVLGGPTQAEGEEEVAGATPNPDVSDDIGVSNLEV